MLATWHLEHHDPDAALRAATDTHAGPDGDDQLHPDTITLYRTLTSPTHAAPVG